MRGMAIFEFEFEFCKQSYKCILYETMSIYKMCILWKCEQAHAKDDDEDGGDERGGGAYDV